ncbi:bifunctional UDP-N-acetylglucosamine diphosphorylase/glucosamine-1-phosphate N-acetyltransferase GlmU [Iocasia frigidifontis]|uniref:Bifunctional protein GlmU n=1 Tax=Iocasia fonsfrigidae TaxID=2682810 RepID=A0A8A7KCB6_9FIRM|nr:bifunctional UDP-N-acetylglucosamine diphosphorylase/glucosamine-1-phosphate N-acetyltransferase GlmU [Iocasia fonsfrigidae]QTL99436.1 bifunctional UDP-N-acetylglucosamine diphosphorylase/glucosamine-1-phosphate N-acetyltransferase GlmU [Iocasia fonsfrigidae]
MSDLLSIILAAGEGTRMKSDLTKVLHQVAGKAMVEHVIDNINEINSQVVAVVGHQGDKVSKLLEGKGVKSVLQKEQLGTGHAVLQAASYIKEHQGSVLILYGDTPLLSPQRLKRLIRQREEQGAAAAVLTAYLEEPSGYGRIIRDNNGYIERIVEEKDASSTEKEIKEINSGVYCFDSKCLEAALTRLDNNNAQQEYYLTDTISYINETDGVIIPVVCEDNNEIIGVNDRVNLSLVEKIIRKRINNCHMKNGVTIIDPAVTYIDEGVTIGRDSIIYPFTYLAGKTEIGSYSVVGSHCRLNNAKIADKVNIVDHCIIQDSKISDGVNIGPFAYIRPGSIVEKGAKIGDFVELKKARIGENSKVPHLSYAGDVEIGKGTNVGAGTIFANYDGQDKHKTKIGDNVFIGSNTTIVAPISIGDGGKTGAGSVVTKDVPEAVTVVGVPARTFDKTKGGSEDN